MKKKARPRRDAKAKLARRMLSRREIKNHTPIFQSVAWEKRKASRAARELARQKV